MKKSEFGAKTQLLCPKVSDIGPTIMIMDLKCKSKPEKNT